jgi:hypothetical protein
MNQTKIDLSNGDFMFERELQSWPQWWHDDRGNVRIMAISEGYVMARRVMGNPFVRSAGDWQIAFKKGKKNVA